VAFSSIKKEKRIMKNSQSLKKNADFQNVYRSGKSFANKYLVMYVKENDLGINRIGISVSKKVGNSVVRHRVKRLILESYRLHEDMFNSSLDMVIIARNTAKDKSYHEIESAVLHLGKLHGIVTKAGQPDIIGN
jgi:ribonuclease P protein component